MNPTALFSTKDFRAVELMADDAAELQLFFEQNPEYFLAVSGQPAANTEAHDEIHGALPDGWPFTKKWIIAFVDEANEIIGMVNIISDLLALGVWHIGLMIVATRLHGSGAAQSMYDSLQTWARDSGAQWMRLGVVEGNLRAERFWARHGFTEVRKRTGIAMGDRVNTVRAMYKPLCGEGLQNYLALVPRDRVDSA